MKYLVSSGGKHQGPYTIDEINILAQKLQIEPTDLAWTEGWAAWRPLSSVPGFQSTKSASFSFSTQSPSFTTAAQNPPAVKKEEEPRPNAATYGKEIGMVVGGLLGVLMIVAILARERHMSPAAVKFPLALAALFAWIGGIIGAKFK